MGALIGLAVLVLALLGTPLFAMMGGMTEVGWTLDDKPLSFLGAAVLGEHFASSKILVTIPLYTFVGYVLAESKTPDRLVHAARAVLGWLPGGLAIVCVIASAVFTVLTGGSGVTIIAIGGLLYPALRKQNYSDKFALGLVTTGGSVGLLLPYSLPLIVYAIVAHVEIEKVFKAVLLPGAIVIVLLVFFSMYASVRDGVKREAPRLGEIRRAVWTLKWELLIPFILVAGLGSGMAEIHEVAGLVAVYVVITQFFIHKDLGWKKDFVRVVKSALSLAGAIVLILAMATALVDLAKDHHVPEKILAAMSELGVKHRWQFFIVMNIFLLVLGMIMEGFSAILVAVPLILPLVAELGRPPHNEPTSPFQLAMIFLLNLELAFCIPPMGLNLFIASFRFNRPVTSLYKVVLPFVGILTASLLLVTYVPAISTVAIQGDIAKERAKAAGQVRLTSIREKDEPATVDDARRKAVDQATKELIAFAQPKLEALDPCYRAALAKVPHYNGGTVEMDATIDSSGAVAAQTCGLKVAGKEQATDEAKALCACMQPLVSAWRLPSKAASDGLLKSSVLTFFLDPPRAPTEAWLLECVQEDTLSPKPCSLEDGAKYGDDGRKPQFVAAPASETKADAGPPAAGGDAGTDDLNDEEMMREMMGGDAAAPTKPAATTTPDDLNDEEMMREMMGDAGRK